MNIDSITNGFVIDHITAGRGMKLYDLLGLDNLDCSVAIIKNVASKKMGKKDIIKIDADIENAEQDQRITDQRIYEQIILNIANPAFFPHLSHPFCDCSQKRSQVTV